MELYGILYNNLGKVILNNNRDLFYSGFTYHPLVFNILVVGAGGGGSNGYSRDYPTIMRLRGGGGGGGLVSYYTGITLTESSYTITIGASQGNVAWNTSTTRSNASSFGALITSQGGMSGGYVGGNLYGGKSGSDKLGVQCGYDGTTKCLTGGGGGGDSTNASGAKGGDGTSNSISGSAVYYAGGGKGGYISDPGNSLGYNGYGAGGAGGESCNGFGVSSVAGVVIIRYTSATQRATGGTITQSGGDWIHTFTSSGTFTLT